MELKAMENTDAAWNFLPKNTFLAKGNLFHTANSENDLQEYV